MKTQMMDHSHNIDFPQYCGPPWVTEHPTWVPTLPLELPCENNCSQIKYLPLSLAWAKTGHTFQRQSTGHG